MKNKAKIIFFVVTTFLLSAAESRALEIIQECFEFKPDITQHIKSITFTISESPIMNTTSAQVYHPSNIYFQIGSATISSKTAKSLLEDLQSQGFTQKTPLFIRGYSCELGSKHFNLILSMQRAVSVANFLEGQGFTVARLEAMGEADPSTTNQEEFSKNRRVEIARQ